MPNIGIQCLPKPVTYVCIYLYLQWLVQKWNYQLAYVLYRWCIALYYCNWLVGSFITGNLLYGLKLFLNITTWGMIILVAYLVVAALSVTFKLIWENSCCSDSESAEVLCLDDLQDPPLSGCGCCCAQDKGAVPWYLRLTWLLFTLSSEVMVPTCIVYWATWDGTVVSWPVNVHEHMVSVVPGLIDLFISGIPVRFLHFIYFMLFTLTYAAFTVIYWWAGGTNADGDRYIYALVNFEDSPLQASLVMALMVLVLPLLVHSLYWGLYLFRVGLLYCKLRERHGEYFIRSESAAHMIRTHRGVMDSPVATSTDKTPAVLSSFSWSEHHESTV